MERTLIIIKPDALQRGLVGKVMTYFENKGLTLAGNKMMQNQISESFGVGKKRHELYKFLQSEEFEEKTLRRHKELSKGTKRFLIDLQIMQRQRKGKKL